LAVGDDSERVLAVPSNGGTLTARLLPVNPRVSYGRIETVARIQLTADSKSAHLLRSITFTNQGSARDMDLQWLKLEMLSGSVLTAPVPHMDAYTAKF